MLPNLLNQDNKEALETYCDILLMLRDMLDDNTNKKPHPKNAVINHVISLAIRKATDSVHPFNYSDSGKKAAQFVSEKSKGSKRLILEHVIPIACLRKHILKNWQQWERDDLRDFLIEYSITAIITKEEDDALKKNGLRQRMPKDISDLDPSIDKFARYNYRDGEGKKIIEKFSER